MNDATLKQNELITINSEPPYCTFISHIENIILACFETLLSNQ